MALSTAMSQARSQHRRSMLPLVNRWRNTQWSTMCR